MLGVHGCPILPYRSACIRRCCCECKLNVRTIVHVRPGDQCPKQATLNRPPFFVESSLHPMRDKAIGPANSFPTICTAPNRATQQSASACGDLVKPDRLCRTNRSDYEPGTSNERRI